MGKMFMVQVSYGARERAGFGVQEADLRSGLNAAMAFLEARGGTMQATQLRQAIGAAGLLERQFCDVKGFNKARNEWGEEAYHGGRTSAYLTVTMVDAL